MKLRTFAIEVVMRIILVGIVLLMTENVFAQTFKSIAQLSTPITDQRICELAQKAKGTIFEMDGLPEIISSLKESIGMPEIKVLVCIIPASNKSLMESVSITTYAGEPFLLIVLNKELLTYFQKQKIVGELLTQHFHAALAYEFAHIAVSDTERCRDLAIAVDNGELDYMLGCEYEADFKAATWVGRESMIQTLRSISGIVRMKRWLIRPGIPSNDPVIRFHLKRIELLSRKEYFSGRIRVSP